MILTEFDDQLFVWNQAVLHEGVKEIVCCTERCTYSTFSLKISAVWKTLCHFGALSMYIHDLVTLRGKNLGLVLAANLLVQILHIGEVLILRWYLRGSVNIKSKKHFGYLKWYPKHWLQTSETFCISDTQTYCMESFHIRKVADKVGLARCNYKLQLVDDPI